MLDNSQLRKQMRLVLETCIEMLFPNQHNASRFIDSHSWRNPRYVGEYDGIPQSWQGWSVNLKKLGNPYRGTLYIDSVLNRLSEDQMINLWGIDFASRILSVDQFVVMHIGNLRNLEADFIKLYGFIPKKTGTQYHATIVSDSNVFLLNTVEHWACYLSKLAQFQKYILYMNTRKNTLHEDINPSNINYDDLDWLIDLDS